MTQSFLKNLRVHRGNRKHIKLAQRLVLHIAEQGLGPGDRLGTENEFVQQHDMSRATVRQALELLEREGFISRRQRHGTFVVRAINLNEDLRRLRGDAMMIMPAQLAVSPEVNLAYFTSFQSIVRELGMAGFSVQVVCLSGRPSEDRSTIQRALEDGNLEGVCAFAVDAAPYADLLAPLPVITIGGYDSTTTPWIGLDVQHIIYSLINHLLDLEHRDIAIVCGPWVDTTIFAEFVTSCRKAFAERNVPFRRDRILTAFEGEELAELAKNLLISLPRPSAVVAEDSRVCRAVLDAAAQLGLRVPEDLSIASIGQNVLGIVKPVPITAYVPDNNSVGREVAGLLARRFGPTNSMPERIFVPGELVVRESSIRYVSRE